VKPFRGKRTELGEFVVVIHPRRSRGGALGGGGARRPPVVSSEARWQGGDAFARRVTGRRGVDWLGGRGAPAVHSLRGSGPMRWACGCCRRTARSLLSSTSLVTPCGVAMRPGSESRGSRHSVRPVLKHGPRSWARARVNGHQEPQRRS